MNIDAGRFRSALQIQNEYLSNQVQERKKIPQSENGFQDIFTKKLTDTNKVAEELKFSKHAGERLADRHLSLTDEQMDRLLEGTKKADAKGINESLVLMDDMAFIVNVKNRTVITAMDQSESKDNIYTNIDGAVII